MRTVGGISCLKNKVYAEFITEYGLDGSQKPISPYPMSSMGSMKSTVSMNCGGNECFHWEDNNLQKFIVTDRT